jgi:hypothetical protein
MGVIAGWAARLGLRTLWRGAAKKIRKNPALMVGIILVLVLVIVAMLLLANSWVKKEEARIKGEVAMELKARDVQIEALESDVKKHEAAYEHQAKLSRSYRSVLQRLSKKRKTKKTTYPDGRTVEESEETENMDTASGTGEDSSSKPILPKPTEIPEIDPVAAGEAVIRHWMLAGDYAIREELWAATVYRNWRPYFATGLGLGGSGTDLTVTGSAHLQVGRFGASGAASYPAAYRVRGTVSF